MTRLTVPHSVLFACTLNAVRSPMAEGLARQMLPQNIYVSSAGLRKSDVDGFAVAVMREVGIDIADHEPQALQEADTGSFDLVVALSPEAQVFASAATRATATEIEFWEVPDLSGAGESRERRLEAFRSVRDLLRRRIRARFLAPELPSR
jgi:protein-tyrosine-phosphatase